MKLKTLLLTLLLLPIGAFACDGHNKSTPSTLKTSSITMKELLTVHPSLVSLQPTRRLPKHVMGKILRIDGKPYQMRFAFFETTDPKINGLTFGEFVKVRKLINQKAKIRPSAYGDVIFFIGGTSKTKSKVHTSFMLSLREIQEHEVAELDEDETVAVA